MLKKIARVWEDLVTICTRNNKEILQLQDMDLEVHQRDVRRIVVLKNILLRKLEFIVRCLATHTLAAISLEYFFLKKIARVWDDLVTIVTRNNKEIYKSLLKHLITVGTLWEILL